MRKIKSTALLGAFVAVASVGVISHEAHGATTVTSIFNTIAREDLPNTVTIPAPVITAGVNYPSSATLTLTLSGGADFLGSYTISGANCSATATSATNILSFANCSVASSSQYSIESLSTTTFSVTVPSQGTNLIVLSYSSNVANDNPSSVTLAQVQQQLSVTTIPGTVYIDPSSLSTFIPTYSYYHGLCYGAVFSCFGTSYIGNNVAYNQMRISSSTGFSISISSDTLNVAFNGIPSSVTGITTLFNGPSDTASVNYTTGTGSATVSLTLPNGGAVFGSPYSDTATFYFSNSGNIQPGTIYISSIQGAAGLYSYFSGSQNFLTFSLNGTQIYVPDALAPNGGNVIQHGYITISMPLSASIASISVLNNPSASCPAPSLSNGLLQPTSTTGVYYINLRQLAQACTGLSASAWQSGVPLVIFISGKDATPNNITADAYAVFNNMLKRIPVNVVNNLEVGPSTQFPY